MRVHAHRDRARHERLRAAVDDGRAEAEAQRASDAWRHGASRFGRLTERARGDGVRAVGGPTDAGRALRPSLRDEMEAFFGFDFSRVRIHDDAAAAEAAAAVGATAFAHGPDVYLGAGQRADDRPLMVHELAHVVQNDAKVGSHAIQRQEAPADATEVKAEFNAFIPGSLGTWLPEPIISLLTGWEFKTDDRGFGEEGTSRVHTAGTATMTSGAVTSARASHRVDASHRRSKTYEAPMGEPSGERWTYETKRADNRGSVTARTEGGVATFRLIGAAAYPFLPGPDIDFDVTLTVAPALGPGGGVVVTASGSHDAFPGYEALIVVGGARTVFYAYRPEDSGPGLMNLNTSVSIPEGTYGSATP